MSIDNIGEITSIAATVIYGSLTLIALWGAFCVVMVWMRVAQKRFKSDHAQEEYLGEVARCLQEGNFSEALEFMEGDLRATSQLASMAIQNRSLGYSSVRELVLDRFQRDVLSDLEYRLSWVYTVIKAAPMVGLLGTVIGMMGAFGKLAAAEAVKPEMLANDIAVALITTASGLAIAIPLVFCTAAINVRIRRMEDLVAAGLTHFLSTFRTALGEQPQNKQAKPRKSRS